MISVILVAVLASLSVRIGYEENYPYSFTGEEGVPSGLYVDIFNEIANEENWVPEYVQGEWQVLTGMLRSGEIDLIACMSVTEERRNVFLFPEESVESGWSILLVRNDGTTPSLQHLNDRNVALIHDDVHSNTLIDLMGTLEIRIFPVWCGSYHEGIQAVLSGEADAIPVPKSIMLNPDLPSGLSPQGIVWSPLTATFAGNLHNSSDLIQVINRNLRQMKSDSTSVYYELTEKWLTLKPKKTIPSWFFVVFAGLLGILASVVFVTNRKLAREIRLSRHALSSSRTLAEVAVAAAESENLDDLCRRVTRVLGRFIDADNFYIAIYEPLSNSFRFPVFQDEKDEKLTILDDPRSFTHYVFHSGKPLMLDEAETKNLIEDPSCPVWMDEKIMARQYIAVPLDAGETRIGVIAFQSYSDSVRFTNDDLQFVISVSRQIGGALLRMKAWEEVKNSREKQQILLDADPTAIFLLDESGTIADSNRTACEITGMNSDALVGNKLSSFLLGEDKSNLDPLKGITASETSFFSCDIIRGTGKANAVEGTVNSFTDKDTRFYFVALFDATEKNLLRQEAIRNERIESIGLLAGGIAHDFNNILTGVMGSLSLLKHGAVSSEKRIELISSAEKATARARKLTGQLLTFSKGGAPIKSSVDTAVLLEEVAVFNLSGSSVFLDLKVEEGTWNLNVDAQQFSQVFGNIVVNAKQAMRGAGRLEVTACNHRKGKGFFVKITFKDNGPGIPEEAIKHIFDPYFTTSENGHGLGLATSFSIVKKHGGTISVSSADGGGAVFSLLVPASTEKKPGESGLKKPAVPEAAGSILILDDDALVAETAVIMLDALGYRSDVVTDGNQAVAKYRQRMEQNYPYTAVIMDLTIPGGMGGARAVKLVLDLDPDAAVIVSSGYAGNDVMANFRKYGFRGVLSKPYTVSELAVSLQNALEK